ncbi:glycosyltransferase GT1 family [Chitinivibrio alkaliphilus]|uniref:Glycosyltransferase, GT1 family n=1 Tax=Chitinivibrio alkaliphilus ACht1 TaxID=1313304 RepID=U7D7C0_9BACT|nr:glycosyltransferase GT1 family [Chitinivibrio alkaliphilus]ERP31471.1 glycosyltransferase, GT1 family [Chitinivibrio alkaliphilus ACht1]
MERIFRSVLPAVEKVYVYPHIEKSSRHNPYLSLLYAQTTLPVYSANPLFPRYLCSPQTTIMHYHWLSFASLTGLIKLCIKVLPLILFVHRGGKIIWTVHNSEPHEGKYRRANYLLRKYAAHRVSRLVVHTEEARKEVSHLFSIPSSHIALCPHPAYPVEPLAQETARHLLTSLLTSPIPRGKLLILMYGYIAPYKGILPVVSCLQNHRFVHLIIAGKVKDPAYYRTLCSIAERGGNTTIIPRFISSEEEQILFSSADYILFNFSKILSSGSFILAKSYQRPCLVRADLPMAHQISNEDILFTDEEDLCTRIQEVLP